MEAKDIKDAGSFDKEDPGKSRDELSYPSELVHHPLCFVGLACRGAACCAPIGQGKPCPYDRHFKIDEILVGAPLNYFARNTVAGWLGDDEDDDMDEGPDDQGEDEPAQRGFPGIVLHPDPA